MDLTISLTPRSTGMEVVHQNGHIFVLSDLFLVCEQMTPQEHAEHGANGADMWLMYPPFVGKASRLSDDPGQGEVVTAVAAELFSNASRKAKLYRST